MDDPIRTIDDAALDLMTDRAWRDAARQWTEYRTYGWSELRAAAKSAEDYWRHLHAEQLRRSRSVGTHGTYDPDDDSTKTPERGYA